MADTYILTDEGLDALLQAIRQSGSRVIAPVAEEGRIGLSEIECLDQVSRASLQAIHSAKGTVFPKVERLLSYDLAPGRVQLREAQPEPKPTVLFGIRPCEAKAFGALDAVFNWDTRDSFFNARMDVLAVIGVACLEADEACFCTSVGGGPGDSAGSDILLTPIAGGWLAEVLTSRGQALQAMAPQGFQPAGAVTRPKLAQVGPVFEHEALSRKLPGIFDAPLWDEQALRCLGCGACAFVCPTCVCFDIQEEADPRHGERLRCWDSCGFGMFTLHASGHNPRNTQGARWRQRVFHKFSTYPDRYGRLGCVGCGKCTRACPVDMNLKEHLTEAAGAMA